METKIFQYRNLLPPDMPDAGQYLLCAMAFLAIPVEQGALRRMLKPVICDDNVPRLLKHLVDGKYLAKRETGQGVFYALTSKSLRYLDIYGEHKPHRNQEIPDAALMSYRLKGEIAAREIVRQAAVVYIAAWDKLSASDQKEYLVKKGVYNREKFDDALAARGVAAIDLLPRNIVDTNDVVKAIADAVKAGRIPFTSNHRDAICRDSNSTLLYAMENLDGALRLKMSLAAQRNAAKNIQSSNETQALRYLELTSELDELEETINNLRLKATIFTHSHGEVSFAYSQLEANGIFMRGTTNTAMYIGVLNNAAYGVPTDVLSRRIDICISLAEQLNLIPCISIYTLPEQRDITKRRIAYLQEKNLLKEQVNIRVIRLPDRNPQPKAMTIKRFLS